jgi:hypothetical protein
MIIKRPKKLYKSTVAVFLALVISIGFAADTTRVLAIPDQDFYSGNDILYYDPDSGLCSTGDVTLTGNNVKEKVWNWLKSKGLSSEQAAGVMGNMVAESGIVPTRHQGTGDVWNSSYTGNAWGLVQWDGGRRYSAPKGGVLGKLREQKPHLEKYVDIKYDTARNPDVKIPPVDLDALTLFELEFLYAESTHRPVTARGYGEAANEWETLKLQKTVADATVFWHNNFEVSADSAEQVLNGRGGHSQKIFDEFSGKPGATSNQANCSEATGDLSQLTLSYAWPEYHPKPYVQKKPEYETAVRKADDENIYTGDPCHGGGVDCGAFVTLLVVNSGFDPAYNHGGKRSEGAGNTSAQAAWASKNWETIGTGSTINVADLRAGDVAISDGHTFIWVGEIEGFQTKIASASQCGRAPMAGTESPTSSDPTLKWYRKK